MTARYGARLVAALFAPLTLLTLAACGGGGGDDPPAAAGDTTAPESTEPTGTPACADVHHAIIVDFAGFLTDGTESDMWGAWIAGEADPTPRPGTVDLTHAYRERGYEIVYVTTAPANLLIEGRPVPEAAGEWILANGYAWDEDGTRVIGYNGTNGQGPDAVLSITSELVRLANDDGLSHDMGYTDNADKAHAMTAGGVPVQRLYMIGAEAGSEGTAAIPEDDIAAHITQIVQPLPPVCTTG